MEDWSELWLFALFLGRAILYALAGGVIMGTLDFASRFFLKRDKDSNKPYLWALGATFLLGMFVQWQGMYQDLEKLKKPQPVIQDDGSRKIIDDLRQQLHERDINIQELKRLKDRAEDATGRAVSDYAALKSKSKDDARIIHDLQNKLTDRGTKEKRRDTIAKFIHTGTQIMNICATGLIDSPQKEFSDWHDQVVSYLKNSSDSSYVIRFTDTIPPDAKRYYSIDGKPIKNRCTETALVVERKLDALRDFLSELSK